MVTAPRSDAADTTEPYGASELDIEGYTGIEGLGRGHAATALYANTLWGYGLLERFSSYVSAGVRSNEDLSEGQVDLGFGVLGTPVDTAHFDWDLIFGATAGGPGLSAVQLGPSTELNLDAAPDLAAYGLYLRGGLPICTRRRNPEGPLEGAAADRRIQLCATAGAYWTVVPSYQLLVEYDMTVDPSPGEDERTVTVGGLALGHNLMLDDTIELITQLYADLPQDDERAAVGMMVGFIATLPTAASPGEG